MMEEIVALERRVTDNMDRLAGRMDKMNENIADVRERLIRMESSSNTHVLDTLQSSIQVLATRIDTLESAKDHNDGVVKGVNKSAEVIHKWLPWVFVFLTTLVANGHSIITAFSTGH